MFLLLPSQLSSSSSSVSSRSQLFVVAPAVAGKVVTGCLAVHVIVTPCDTLLCLRSPQTYIGSILAAVNPYQLLPGLYDQPAVESYSRHHLGQISPHIFAVANECYRSLWKRLHSQCVLIRWAAALTPSCGQQGAFNSFCLFSSMVTSSFAP